MSYLLATSACVQALRGHTDAVDRLARLGLDDVALSTLTHGLAVVTEDVRELRRVPNLEIEEWG